MEEIIKQSFEYAEIRLFKNYSNISSRQVEEDPEIDWIKDDEDDDPFVIKKYTVTQKSVYRSSEWIPLYVKGKKRSKYFYTTTPTETYDDNSQPGCPKIPIDKIFVDSVQGGRIFETMKSDKIKKYYGDPFAIINIKKIERWIKKDGDKITIKLYYLHKSRNVNDLFFRKQTTSTTVTFDLKKGNFNAISYNANKKGKHKNFYCNSYLSLRTAMEKIYYPGSNMTSSSAFYGNFRNEFSDYLFQMALKTTLGLDKITFTNMTSTTLAVNFCDNWMNKFIEIKQIKCPDNGTMRLIKFYYPTERYLKKNDGKLISSILDFFGIKSKITIKILHLYPSLSIKHLVILCGIFGNDYSKYLGNIDPLCFIGGRESDMETKQQILKSSAIRYRDILDIEKENVIKIINNCAEKHSVFNAVGARELSNIIPMILDHFDMLENIYPYYPNTKLSSTTFETFNEEHTHLSELSSQIKTGYSIQLQFEKYIIDEIEKPIDIPYLSDIRDVRNRVGEYSNIGGRTFIPKLLKSTEDYYEEGKYVHHCVAGYVKTERSIIVSLRWGDDRVTCEYDIRSKKCEQVKYFKNDPPPAYYERALKELENRISRIPFKIGPIDRIKIPYVINGTPVEMVEEEPLLW